jgi:hypothetical protein
VALYFIQKNRVKNQSNPNLTSPIFKQHKTTRLLLHQCPFKRLRSAFHLGKESGRSNLEKVNTSFSYLWPINLKTNTELKLSGLNGGITPEMLPILLPSAP